MRGRVLVTRPEPGASQTARRLAEAGFEPVVLPLTEIRALPVREISDAIAMDAVAVTSANALRYAPPDLLSVLSAKPCFAVGQRTADAAREAGFVSIVEGSGDADGLAREILGKLRPGSHLLYLCGRVRRDGFETVLTKAGILVAPVETYDTLQPNHATAFVISTFGDRPVDMALVLSARAAEAVSALAERDGLSHLFVNTVYFCISKRVAAALSGVESSHIAVAGTPDEDTLVALLEGES